MNFKMTGEWTIYCQFVDKLLPCNLQKLKCLGSQTQLLAKEAAEQAQQGGRQ